MCMRIFEMAFSCQNAMADCVYSLAGGKYIFPFIVVAMLIRLAIYESSNF